jgi:hypothetical protein
LAGGGPPATNSRRRRSGPARESAASGGVSGRLSSIPVAGKKRTARRNFPASRRGRGRRLAAAAGDGRGGHVGRARGREAEEGKSTQEREGKEGSGRGTYPLVLEVGAIIQADDRGAVASGGHGAARQLPACLRKKIGKG